MDGRLSVIGILSDAHGNIVAFRSAISHLKWLGAKEFYFLGDALGYIPSVEVVQELMNMGDEVKCILGNHEVMVLTQTTNPEREAIYQHRKVFSQLTKAHTAFCESWPTYLRESIAGSSLLFVHGSPNDFTNEYVYPDSDLTQFIVREDFVFMGHSHYPFVKKHNGVTFVNVGSCGLPRDDGRYGSCAMFVPETRNVLIYRYLIERPITDIPESFNQELHPSVIELFKRRSESFIGQVLTKIETNL